MNIHERKTKNIIIFSQQQILKHFQTSLAVRGYTWNCSITFIRETSPSETDTCKLCVVSKKKEDDMEDFPDDIEWMNQSGNAGKRLIQVRRGEPAAWSKTLIRARKRPQMNPRQHSWTVLRSKVSLEVRWSRLTLVLTLKYRHKLES